MTIPRFIRQTNTSPLYVLDEPELALSGAAMAFLHLSPSGEAYVREANELTLTDIWNALTHHPGVFLFFKQAIAAPDIAAVVQRIQTFKQDPALRQTQFLWVENPLDLLSQWRYTAVPLVLTTAAPLPTDEADVSAVAESGTTVVEPGSPPEAVRGAVPHQTILDFRNYGLAIAAGVQCRLDETGNTLVLEPTESEPVYLSTGYGAYQLRGIEGPIKLPFSGRQAGCLQFTLTLALPSLGQGYEELTQLDVALRMFFQEFDPALEEPETTAAPDKALPYLISDYRYPLFEESPTAVFYYPYPLSFHVNLDPLQLLPSASPEATRTFFSFRLPESDSPDVETATLMAEAADGVGLPSGYRTNLGYTIYLTPARTTRLVFAERPITGDPVFASPLYLVPEGDFAMAVPVREETERAFADGAAGIEPEALQALLGGLSGVEFIRLEPQRLNLLSFRPQQPAFLPTFRPHLQPSQAKTPNPLPQARMTRQAETAWAFVHQVTADNQPQAAVYYAQPDLSLLYQASEITDENQNARDNLLSFLDVPVTGIPQPTLSSTPDPSPADWGFPLLPYGGVVGQLFFYQSPPDAKLPPNALVFYRQLEQQYVNPTRRSRIVELSRTDTTPLVLDEPAAADTAATAPSAASTAPEALPSVVGESPISTSNDDATETTTQTTSERPDITGVTPQGFLTTYSGNFETIKSILLAKDTAAGELKFENLPRRILLSEPAAAATAPEAAVTPTETETAAVSIEETSLAPQNVRSLPLRDAFQSNQMFLVISDPNSFFKNRDPESGVSYFESHRLIIQDWTFDLDPSAWRDDTILIFKFFDKPLVELITDETLWSFKDDFNERESIQAELVERFQEIQERGAPKATERDRENYGYLAKVIALDSWSGILALNVNVPPSDIPSELKALVAGIKREDFYAQYIVIETTPVLPVNGKLEAQQSSLFALIDYQDDSIPQTGPKGYAFQVATLRVLFQNSQVKAFSSEINITLDQLFNERSRLLNSRTGRNLVILKGTAENHNGVTRYTYSFSGENYFVMPDSQVLDSITIVKANFSTDPLPPVENGKVSVTGRFTFWGHFNFRELNKFDAFSFGADQPIENKVQLKSNSSEKEAISENAFFETEEERRQREQNIENVENIIQQLQDNEQFLPFANLLITMTFELEEEDSTPASADTPAPIPDFNFDAGQISYDLKRSQFRKNSLYGMFPIKLASFIQITETAQPSGFMAVKNPLGSGSLPAQGYGFIYELNLGSLGALAGSAQLVVRLLLAWTPNTEGDSENANVFVGLQLPGIGGDVLGFPLQSVLKLSFKSLEFVVDRERNSQTIRGYLLKLRNLALKILVLSLPPSGQTELIIFGNPKLAEDPELRGKSEAVGWYAAYAKDPTPPQGNQPARASPTQRR
jgi:hypothetical protein